MQNQHWDEATTAVRRALSKPDKHQHFVGIDGKTIENGQHHRRLTPFFTILKEQGIFIEAKKGKAKVYKHGKRI